MTATGRDRQRAGKPTAGSRRDPAPTRLRLLAWSPVALLVFFLVAMTLVAPRLGVAMLRFLPLQVLPLGSESSLIYLVLHGTPLLAVYAFLCVADLATSFPFLVLAPAAKRVPVLGRHVARLETAGLAFFGRHPWLARLGPLGLLLFVAVPLSGTGTTVGVLVGRATGLASTAVAAAVCIGTLLRWSFVVGVAAAVGGLV